MVRSRLTLALGISLVTGCSNAPATCGAGSDPVIATGLNGVVDGTPVVEILSREPDTCETIDRTYMFWDETLDRATFGELPTSGTLSRQNVDVTDETIFFRDLNLGVRLEYDGGVVGSGLRLVWFSVGVDLAAARCDAVDGLSCASE